MNRRNDSWCLLWHVAIAWVVICFVTSTCRGQVLDTGGWRPSRPGEGDCCPSGACLKIAGEPVDTQGFGWYKIKPIRGTGWTGVAGEVLSRSKRVERQERDLGTIVHETTHYLNSQIRNEVGRKTGQDAAYVPGGHAVVIPKTGIRMVDFAQSSRSLIGSFYWSNGTPVDAIALIDEYSAYMCGMAARVNYPNNTSSSPSGDLQRGRWIETDLWRLKKACQQRGYPYVHRIDELLTYGSAYFAQLEREMGR